MRSPVTVSIGAGPESRTVGPISQTDIVRFAGAGGDFNPLHHDPEFVRSSGFPGVIAMGQMHAGILAGLLSDWVGVEHIREYEVRFVAPVFLGDILTASAIVTSVNSGGDGDGDGDGDGTTLATVELTLTRGDDTAIRGSALVVAANDQ
ncbi:MaoC/PaaZ C-terminal domain-containing protein [Rhodococcus sp. YH3-3]|uniref:MaoC/PaaZ C-terminal domain-containing protein n=1 Tax=Rhodococcus sp. YH3-3 TaxID=1803579 RepID=UPI0009EE1F13|nr:MaoC/PaaZ C-terminal domain-containing protein [Rhodococcus sp. YH3-3]